MKEIIISKAFVEIPNVCPECKSKNKTKLKKALITCQKCHHKYLVTATHNPLKYYSEMIEEELSKDNGIILKTQIIESEGKKEEALKNYEVLRKIKEQKEKQKCWDVGNIEEATDIEKKIKCMDCGSCNNCVTCFSCGEHYVPKKKEIKCPNCKSTEIKKTLIKKFEKKDGKNTCPYCKSEDVYWTYFYKNRLEGGRCPICKGNNLIFGKEIKIKQLIIERKDEYKIK